MYTHFMVFLHLNSHQMQCKSKTIQTPNFLGEQKHVPQTPTFLHTMDTKFNNRFQLGPASVLPVVMPLQSKPNVHRKYNAKVTVFFLYTFKMNCYLLYFRNTVIPSWVKEDLNSLYPTGKIKHNKLVTS